jgi:phage/plasmid-like protein (TIGR03299 family)
MVPERMAMGHVVIYRSDTGDVLGLATDDYKPVQPSEVVEFFRDLCSDHGFAMETAGALRGGKRYFALARTPGGANLSDKGFDPAVLYLLLVSSADCTISTTALPTSVRVVCANTLRAAMGSDGETAKSGAIKNSHRRTFDPTKIKEALGYKIGGLESDWDRFVAAMRRLGRIEVADSDTARDFFCDLLRPPKERPEDVPAGEMNDEQFHVSMEIATEREREPRGVETLMQLYARAPGAMPGTARGLVEAVSYYVDHSRGRTDESRMDSAVFGQGALLKQKAVNEALKLVGK